MDESGELDKVILSTFKKVDNDIVELSSLISKEITDRVMAIDTQNNKINGILNGNPTPVNSISQMTNTSKIYVNTTDGKWYYHNGSSWVAGGVFQSTQNGDNTILRDHLKIAKFGKIVGKHINVSFNDNTFTAECPSGTVIHYEDNFVYINEELSTSKQKTSQIQYLTLYIDNTNKPVLDILSLNEFSKLSTKNKMYIIGCFYDLYFTPFISGDRIYVKNYKKSKEYYLPVFNIVQGYINVDTNNRVISIIPEGESPAFFAMVPELTNGLFQYREQVDIEYPTENQAKYLYFDYINNEFIIDFFHNSNLFHNYIPILTIYGNRVFPIVNPEFIKVNGKSYYETVLNVKTEGAITQTLSDCTADIMNPNKTTKIVLVGDSITHGQGGTGWEQTGETIVGDYKRSPNSPCWAKSFKEYIESNYNATVLNNGCTGTNTTFLVNNINTLIPTDTDIVIISYGTNNRGLSSSNNYNDVYNTMVNDFNTIINYCNSNGIKYIINSPIPSSVADETRIEGERSRQVHLFQINNIINAISSIHKFEYNNMYNLINNYCQNNGIDWSAKLKDGLHPNDEGYQIMFEQLLNGLNLGKSFE